MKKVKFFANYATSEELLIRFNKNYIIKDNSIEFTSKEDYDVAVVFNRTFEPIKVDCKIITIIQEPSFSPIHQNNDFLKKSDFLIIHDSQLFEKTLKIKLGKEVIESPSYMWFHDHVDYNFFNDLDKVKKRKKLSMIVSNIYMSVGNYVKRIGLVEKILKSDLDIDIFGRGLNIEDLRYKGELENKFSGLIPYDYSIAIENSCEKNYLTEKFIDPILCYTTPIYYGAPNVDEIYPEKSFIKINLDSVTIIDDIKSIIEKPRPTQNLMELKDAKSVYLHEYNLYTLIKKLCLQLE